MVERTTIIIALVICGCTTDREVVVEPGRLEFNGQGAMISVPATAGVGEPVQVSVMTYGGGCIAFESTEVEMTPAGADFRPFDRRVIPRENEKCPQILRLIPHDEVITFDAPGSKQISIHGRRKDGLVDEEISIDVALSIQ